MQYCCDDIAAFVLFIWSVVMTRGISTGHRWHSLTVRGVHSRGKIWAKSCDERSRTVVQLTANFICGFMHPLCIFLVLLLHLYNFEKFLRWNERGFQTLVNLPRLCAWGLFLCYNFSLLHATSYFWIINTVIETRLLLEVLQYSCNLVLLFTVIWQSMFRVIPCQ